MEKSPPYIVTLLMVVLSSMMSYGQHDASPTKSMGIGGVVRGNGLGVNLFYDWKKQSPWTNQLNLDFVSHKHANEARIVNHTVSNKQPFVLGKLNHVGLSRLTFGKSLDLIPKGTHGKLAVALQSNLGVTAAWLRPVYVRIDPREDVGIQSENVRYTPQNVENPDRIVGYSRNGYGWDELSVLPGVLFRSNIACTWSAYGQSAKQLVAGFTLDYFPSGLPVMATYSNPNFYAGVFVGLNWMLNIQQ